ncbi:PVC-type heme-binding CxxCH protein [Chitinophaga alhagiae]|uniref:PVC-type heme-binding CxxCH protein n=1 Tax=Chitinophaga alhagiae TaxID=2203219 RepID=UPI0018E4E167|nr:PVC-type heme-binding CxxCH protein [Chitinophaga alhagiae]
MNKRFHVYFLLGIVCCLVWAACGKQAPRKIEILFLGHQSEHHNSALYMPMLASALATEGIQLTYTDDPDDLNSSNLAQYDGLMLYANHDSITPQQEEALLQFVRSGKGFIPVHCASYCFRNSSEFVSMVGGQFLQHGTDSFTAVITDKTHPVTQSLREFATWDETYVHDKLTDDRTVLMERVEGAHREPWTWVKQYGKGRVFYTAYGHDERTWNNPGFHALMKAGILWAVGDDVKALWEPYRASMPTLAYRMEANIPNYEQRVPAPRYQEPLSPEASAKLIQVPPGFELQLFASEPDIINPIAMDWDEKGRLWVIETVDYPNTVREDKSAGDDRIKICEDTDGDGRADKFTIFAEGLNIPTSLVFSNDGIIVSQAPHFLFLKDTTGDGKADIRKVIIDGWGTFDTHAGPSNLRYGMDNQIWGTVGYSGFKGAIAGEPYQFGQGFYRFAPDVSTFEFMTGTSNNTWGLGFTENNDIFGSTANNTHSVFMGIPNRALKGVEGIRAGGSSKIDGHYAMHPVTQHVRQVDVFGGFTAAAGHSFYTARNYPEAYWNNIAFVCEPTGHLVHSARIEKDGAGFKEKDGWNLFASADEWVAPVEAKPGPDGAVWVLDWYNFIVQHNPTPTPERGGYAAVNGKGNAYENPLRDKSHGRVWRVVSKNAKKVKPLQLSKKEPEGLLAALENDNMLWRTTAQRLLVERGQTDVLPQLAALTQKDGPAALHALWAIDGLGATAKDNTVAAALKHKNPAVRKAAIQILSKYNWTETQIIGSGILQDPDANTRLAALVSLTATAPSEKLGGMLYEMSGEEAVKKDEWLGKALYAAATRHRKGFIDAFMATHPGFKIATPVAVNRAATALNDAAWKEMQLPSTIEDAGLEIDGVIWFRKTVNITAPAREASLSLGPVDDSDETFVNGVSIGKTERKWNVPRRYKIPAGLLKPGSNVIAVRVEDTGNGGGIYGKPEDLYLQNGNERIVLTGNWRYEVEKITSGRSARLFGDAGLAETFVRAYLNKPVTEETAVAGGKAAVIQLKVIKNEMKYDLKTFTVEAGKPVEIVFENPDFMQHNLVITRQGALAIVGKAADKMASRPDGAEKHYVPEVPEVLYSTRLVNPQEKVTLRFTAPAQPGDYPFVCTFPGHWSIMNGIMKVVLKK